MVANFLENIFGISGGDAMNPQDNERSLETKAKDDFIKHLNMRVK